MKKTEYTISPYPAGKDFAFSIVDDTDYSFGSDIKPVYDFLHSCNLKTTKTVWVFNAQRQNAFSEELERSAHNEKWGASLEDREYLDFVKDLESKGFEIALHGVSAGNDERGEIIAGYEKFNEIFGYYPSMDILHAQNIENLYCGKYKLDSTILKTLESFFCKSDYQGHIEGSKYFWGDISKKYVRYVRLPFHEIDEINLLKINPSMPCHDPERRLVNFWYPSSNGSNYSRFMRLTRPNNIARLVKERGTAIVYTHFANGFTENIDGTYVLKEEFKKRMSYIKNLNGWFATATQILDRLLTIKDVGMHILDSGLLITNVGVNNVSQLTLLGPPNQQYIDLSDTIYQSDYEGKVILNSMPRKSTLLLQFNNSQKQQNISYKHERNKIEWLNYSCSIKNKIFKR